MRGGGGERKMRGGKRMMMRRREEGEMRGHEAKGERKSVGDMRRR